MMDFSSYIKFSKTAHRVYRRPISFVISALIILVWLLSGGFLGFGNLWQKIISTSASLITLLMLFIIHKVQNHNNDAMQLKLDELMRVNEDVHNTFISLENNEEEL